MKTFYNSNEVGFSIGKLTICLQFRSYQYETSYYGFYVFWGSSTLVSWND